MTTIYTNGAERTIELDLPIVPTGPVEVTVRANGTVVHEAEIAASSTPPSFTVPFTLVQSDKELEIFWRFPYVENGETYEYNNSTEVSIVTPILPLKEVKAIVGEDFSDEEITEVERAVRYIIQAHTGQFFGKYIGERSISGSGDTFLRMPSRLITLTSVNGNQLWNQSLALRGGGWFLQARTWGIPSIRADYHGWHEDPWSGSVPISAPYSRNLSNFIKHEEYVIDGVWGWKSVPLAVQEAARLLVNDYACGDSTYRDRFLTSMTAADWRIQFHEGAFSNTGNVRANQLLAEFVLRRGWVVI